MDLELAVKRANQILDEERTHPTVAYRPSSKLTSGGNPQGLAAYMFATKLLGQYRNERPREVIEDSSSFECASVNRELLSALLSQVDNRDAFVASLLKRLYSYPGCVYSRKVPYPAWAGYVSEFPLITDFCVRNGFQARLVSALSQTSTFMPGHAVLMLHMEEIVAFDFMLFGEEALEKLSQNMATLKERANKQLKEGPVVAFPSPKQEASFISKPDYLKSIAECADGLREQCRKARYLYLKASLLQGLNLEVNQDKAVVIGHLERLGFSKPLIESLNHAELLYRQSSTPLDWKSCMGHLRSFLENLHVEAEGSRPAVRWGPCLTRLRERDLLSLQEEQFVASLYTLISDEAVHPLIAAQEYARLARNIVIEYALLFLTKVAKQHATTDAKSK